jgi:hypothetical protein
MGEGDRSKNGDALTSDILIEPMGAEAQSIRDARLRQIIAEVDDWAARSWTYEQAPNRVVYSLLELAYSFPKRAHDLIQSMTLLMKGDRLVPAVILGRALVETVAMGRYYIETLEKHLAARDFHRLESAFWKFFMGSRAEGSVVKSIHINDALRDLEARDLAYLEYLVAKFPERWAKQEDPVAAFRQNASLTKTYDRLSEISHPNGLGTQYLYPAADAPENGQVVEHYRYSTGAAIWQAHHLITGLRRLEDFGDRFVAAFPHHADFSQELLELNAAKPK